METTMRTNPVDKDGARIETEKRNLQNIHRNKEGGKDEVY
jgi:hypothetical protein